MKEIKLCNHLKVVVTSGDTTGNICCGVCKKVWRWDLVREEFYLIFDPQTDKEEDFNPECPNPLDEKGE